MTHYLKFADRDQAIEKLSAVGLYHPEQDDRPSYFGGDGVTVDVVGTIYEQQPIQNVSYDPANGIGPVAEPVPHEGFHVNVLGPLDESLTEFKVHPSTPRRKFFGVD